MRPAQSTTGMWERGGRRRRPSESIGRMFAQVRRMIATRRTYRPSAHKLRDCGERVRPPSVPFACAIKTHFHEGRPIHLQRRNRPPGTSPRCTRDAAACLYYPNCATTLRGRSSPRAGRRCSQERRHRARDGAQPSGYILPNVPKGVGAWIGSRVRPSENATFFATRRDVWAPNCAQTLWP